MGGGGAIEISLLQFRRLNCNIFLNVFESQNAHFKISFHNRGDRNQFLYIVVIQQYFCYYEGLRRCGWSRNATLEVGVFKRNYSGWRSRTVRCLNASSADWLSSFLKDERYFYVGIAVMLQFTALPRGWTQAHRTQQRSMAYMLSAYCMRSV